MNKELGRRYANPMSHHYAFHVSDAEFDAILQRVGGTVSQPDPRDYQPEEAQVSAHRDVYTKSRGTVSRYAREPKFCRPSTE